MYHYKLSCLAVLLFCINSNIAMADTAEFLELLNKQTSLLEKSVVCFRVLDISSHIGDISLSNLIKNNGLKKDIDGVANSLFNTKARAIFLKKVSSLKGLDELRDKGYEAGVGMDLFLTEVRELISRDCGEGVNKLMSQEEYKNEKDAAYQEAKIFVQELIKNQKEPSRKRTLSENQRMIIMQVIAVDGVITKKMHDDFWKDMPNVGDDLWEKISQAFIEFSKLNQIYQKELWQSALLSYEQQKVIRTYALEDISIKIKNYPVENNPFNKGSAGYEGFIKGYESEAKVANENADRLLEAASKRASVNFLQGEVYLLNDQSIKVVLEGLDKSVERFEKLINREWKE